MSSSPPTEAPIADAFICDCDGWFRSACEELPFYKKHEGKQYCVLHYPDKDKVAPFNEALQRKLDKQDFNFSGVWFPDTVDFNHFTFVAPVVFNSATFSAEADFRDATFNENAIFYRVTFSAEANFSYVTFRAIAKFSFTTFGAVTSFGNTTFGADVSFDFTTFKSKAYFTHATFSAEAEFSSTTFNADTSFVSAIFKDYARFAGDGKKQIFNDKSSLNLQFARIEKPDRLSFHTLTLRPYWFVNVDARKVELINVRWNWRDINTKQEIKDLELINVSSTHNLLAIACRNLAVNAEENHRYEEASRFRYMAMDARRLERWRGFAFWTLGWWYWLASGYGERVWRAFVVLVGVWLVAAALYTGVGFARWEPRVSTQQEAAEARRDEVGEPLRWPRALTYSLGVMTLQKPEPRPATNAAQSLVMLETILGPVQAALLALAIRRKFMR